MKIIVSENSAELGKRASSFAAAKINEAIKQKGYARIVLSTGASQFDTLNELIKEDVDWNKIEMFHLDEYVDLPISHPASFRKYLQERFVSKVNLKAAYFVNGEGNIEKNILDLTNEINKAPIDVGLIGIGENAHIAFNDPPADFNTQCPYIVVNLNIACKKQQVGEGWFATVDDVPKQAISMSVNKIMSCKCIISCVPDERKADAIYSMITSEVTPDVPASILKEHEDVYVFIDKGSASKTPDEILANFA